MPATARHSLPRHPCDNALWFFRPQMISIGGVFPLEPDRPITCELIQPRSLFQDYPALFTVNARSALFLLVQKLRPQRIWLPSFLCPELLTIPIKTSTPSAFYNVDEDLRPDLSSLKARTGDLVVCISYFGLFSFSSDAIESLRSDGITVVEDGSQDFFAAYRVKSQADYLLLSPRKFMGVPDGGILIALNSPDPWSKGVDLHSAPADWFEKAMAACEGRRLSEKSKWYEAFVESEGTAPIGPYKMSDISRRIIDTIPVTDWAAARRRNYRHLAKRLAEFALKPTLASDQVPLGFPIRCEMRDAIRLKLFRSAIYPPVHWMLPDHRLSAKIMTLPSDQRYSEEDMERIAIAFRAAAEEVVI